MIITSAVKSTPATAAGAAAADTPAAGSATAAAGTAVTASDDRRFVFMIGYHLQ
jgi:hypothetical protein